MARIRSVKPDFWEDEAVGSLSPLARLLFLGSWNLADDEGILRWTPDYLNASLFMYDGLSVKRVKSLMEEVEATGLIFPYEPTTGGRQKLGFVVRFRRHQKINRPQPGKYQPPHIGSERVRLMYAERDKWTCHLCGGAINQERAGAVVDGIKVPGDSRLNLSLDHVRPRITGGDDQPSNIRAAHVGCNKARRDRPLPDSEGDSLNESVNAPGTFTEDSLRARKEQGSGIREVEQGAGIPTTSDAQTTRAEADAGTLIAEWLDHVPTRPPSRIIARVGRTLRELLTEGIDVDHVRRGLALWVERGKDPSSLPSFVHEAQRPAVVNGAKPSTTDQRVGAALDLAAQLREAEQAGQTPAIGA